MEKDELFQTMKPARALAKMAVPTIASQMVILLYNLADTWFMGRTNNPYVIAASSLALTVYLAVTALANVFGVGGGSLMARLIGEGRTEDAKSVSAYGILAAASSALTFSLLVLIFSNPLLRLLGASDNTIKYAMQYVLTTTVLGGTPTVLSMCMPQFLRNAGYSREAGAGIALGSILNIALDPLFMFVLLPKGEEVLGAGIATALSNVVSMLYFIFKFRMLRDKSVLALPKGFQRLDGEKKRSFYSVGLPAAIAIFLFDLVTIVINRLTASYGDIPLGAMGIVLKIERIPINIGLGVCLGMVPLVAYNYGAKNWERMARFYSLARGAVIGFSCACALLFWSFAQPIIRLFMAEEETIACGAAYLGVRCLALPFMMAGYLVVNFSNAVNKGKIAFVMAVIRHLVLIIPLMLFMNMAWGINGLLWAQPLADVINALIAFLVRRNTQRSLCEE